MTQQDAAVSQPAPQVEPPPPAAPRARTARAARRSWAEMRVRVWWLCALGLLGVAVYVVGVGAANALADRALVNSGLRVDATITEIDGITRERYFVNPDANAEFAMKFKLPSGQTHTVRGKLKDQRVPLTPTATIPLFIDPANPNRWTDRQRINWHEVLLGAYLLLPLVALLTAVAAVRRRGVLRVWESGEAGLASVVEVRNSPLAPFSRMVRMALADSRDHRVFSALVPTSGGVPQVGDSIWVVMPPGRPTRAIVAKLYQD